MKPNRKKPSAFSVINIAWFFVCTWIVLLIFIWYSGILHTTKNPALLYVDKVLNKTEYNLRKAESIIINDLKHIHVPKVDDLKELEKQINNLEKKFSDLDFSEVRTHASKLHQQNYNRGQKYDLHTIFSTDCSEYQDWESLVVFYTATIVRQNGPVTRIASGCDEAKKIELTKLYKMLYPHYHVHFTPDFKGEKHYDFFNKPYGVLHWLEKADPPVQDDCVVAIIDPDFIFLRPLTIQVKNHPTNLFEHRLELELFDKIVEGKPVGQKYGLGAPWADDHHKRFNRTMMCGLGSPCLQVKQSFGEGHYSVGPPYMAHKNDMYRITKSWTNIVPRVHSMYPFLLAEMYAYSMGAAHEKLPHFQMEQHMVSNNEAGGEGWPFVDVLDDPCQTPNDEGIYFPTQKLPTFIHYCQTYNQNGIGFAKRRAPKNMFSCEAPLFKEFPSNYYTSTLTGNKRTDKLAKRDIFMVCAIHRSINGALIDYKQRMCHGNGPHVGHQFINTNKTINVLGRDR